MDRGLYITSDVVGSPGGGGAVTRNESLALKELFDDVVVLDAATCPPVYRDLARICPFLYDYFVLSTLQELDDLSTIQLAHVYSGCFSATVDFLEGLGVPVTYTCPAHDREISRVEHEAQGDSYPYPHLTDPKLWEQWIAGLTTASRVVAPSLLAADFLKANGIKRLTVIHHGIGPELLTRPIAPLPEVFTLGYLGQTGPDKGLRYLIQAWGELDYPDARLVLAGSGTEHLGPSIRKWTNGGRFELAGWVESPDKFYDACTVYVQPSSSESWGIEVVEALAHGRYTLCSKGAGASSVLDGFYKQQFQARDVASIKQAISEAYLLWRGKSGVHPIQETMREIASGYTWPVIHKQYQELWKSLI